jgi:CheY-like chemotaxis protein
MICCYNVDLMHPIKILVIEDSEAEIVLLRNALDHQGEIYELEILRDGEEALRFVHEHRTGVREPVPCVILLDLYLPRYDGMAVLKAIRQEPALEHIHIVVWTGLASPDQKVEIANLGALYKRKPSTLDELEELAAEIIAICKNLITATTAAS